MRTGTVALSSSHPHQGVWQTCSLHRRWPLQPADVVDGRGKCGTRRGNESVVLAARDSSLEDGALGLQTGIFRRWPIPRISGLECRGIPVSSGLLQSICNQLTRLITYFT